MAKNNAKTKEKKRQKKVMKKRQKDVRRHRGRGTMVMSENAVQHQMISNFGNVQNFVKAVQHLGTMFSSDAELTVFRFDPEKIYAKIDLAQMREPMADMYAEKDLTAYDEQYEALWKEKRKEVLEDVLEDEFVKKLSVVFEKLAITKKGFKKDYRAVMAGKLLLESHMFSITEAPAHENTLWELLFNAALKENPKDLPEPAEQTEAIPEASVDEQVAPDAEGGEGEEKSEAQAPETDASEPEASEEKPPKESD